MASVGQMLSKRLGQFIAGRNPTPRPRPFAEMGTSGTAVWGGYVQVKERSPQWVGRQKYITSSELAINTSIVAAGVHYFLNLVAYPKWTFRATDEDDEEALALAEFADNVVNDMDTPWYKVVRRAAMYRFHGFGLQEWTAKHRDDGLIGFKDIESRPQHTIEQWDIDVDGSVLGVWQRSPQTGTMLGIPRDKLLYLVEDTLTDSPEGIGMFRHMADPYQRLKQMQDLEIRAFERDLRGTPIARAPLTMLDRAVSQGVITQAESDRMVADFEQLVKLQVKQSDTGIVMDSLPYFSDSDSGDQVSALPQWNFELLSGGGVGHAEVAAGIERLQREIARMIGTEHLMMGGDAGANRSLAEDKSRNLYLIANSVLKYIASKVKGDVLVPLWKLNGFPMKKMPEPKPEDVTFKNVDAVTSAIQKLGAAGAPLTPNDPVINDVRDLLGVTRVPDDVMAQGAMPQNPMLAGIPPHLQQAGLNGKGGRPINLGGGGPGKQPGMGGGALPGTGGFDPTKKYAKEDPEDEDDGGKPIRRLNGELAEGDSEARKPSLGARRQVDTDQADSRSRRDPQEESGIISRGAARSIINGRGKPSPTDAKDGLGTPRDLNEDEAPKEDPINPGHIDIGHERAKVKETIDEPPQVQQAVLGSANPIRPGDPKPSEPKPGPAEGRGDEANGERAKTVLARGVGGGPASGSGDARQPTIGGIPVEQKGNGKVEIDSALLVRLLDRLSEKPGQQLEPKADAGKPSEGAPKVEADKDKPGGIAPAAKPDGKLTEASAGQKPVAINEAAGEPIAVRGKPQVAAEALGPAAQAADAGPKKPQVDVGGKQSQPQQGKAPMPTSAAGGIPSASGKTGVPPGMEKPGVIDPKTGDPLPLAAVNPKTGKPVPTAVDPVTNKPVHGAVDPNTGQPAQIPGMPQAAPNAVPQEKEPEMTAERASEILQPYAENEKGPEEEEPRTESDVLWSRLGEEKDVQPNVSDVDPVTGHPIDNDIGDPLAGELSLEAGDGTEPADSPAESLADEDDAETEEEAATRARLREHLETASAGGSPPPSVREVLDQPVEEEEQRPPRERLIHNKLKPRRPRIRL